MSVYEDMALVPVDAAIMLRRPAPVNDIDGEIREAVPYLIRTMRREEGVGISANQVGLDRALFVTNVPGDHVRIYINPVLENLWGMDVEAEEGCISFPSQALTVQRKRHARVRAFNLKGHQMIVDTSSPLYSHQAGVFLSVAIQHELDHMNGIDMREYL